MEGHLWDIASIDTAKTDEIAQAGNVTRPIAMALAGRDLEAKDVSAFLNPSLNSLSDPYDMPGTVKAAERLWQAICNREKILIHGDYDTDGITSSVLLAWVLKQNGADATCFLPHRIDDGYGLTPDSVQKACEDHALLVTVDCGITSLDAAEFACQQGLDVIITDHHEPGEQLPKASAIVNPKLPKGDPTLFGLAGVGVTFKVCHAFIKYGREHALGGMETDLREGLDLVALGTVADIVPLLHENRAMVKYGLEVLSRQHRPGIRALCEIARVEGTIRTTDIAFRLAPRLNAAGRMGDPSEALQLLQARSIVEAANLADCLDRHNKERQAIEEGVFRQAEAQILAMNDLDSRRSIVVAGEEWHQGVIGIVASRLVRTYHRPCVVLSRDTEGQWCGSGRSIRRINLVEILESCGPLLTRYGGHAMAAGLSMHFEKLDDFTVVFENAIAQILSVDALKPHLDICGYVQFAEMDDIFFEELKNLEPFGHGNPEPVFAAKSVYPDRTMPAGQRHTRGTISDNSGARFNFIAFGKTVHELPPPPWKIAFTPQINIFNGQKSQQLKVIDIQPNY